MAHVDPSKYNFIQYGLNYKGEKALDFLFPLYLMYANLDSFDDQNKYIIRDCINKIAVTSRNALDRVLTFYEIL